MTKRVRFTAGRTSLSSIATPYGVLTPGAVIELDDEAQAKSWVKGGDFEAVDEVKPGTEILTRHGVFIEPTDGERKKAEKEARELAEARAEARLNDERRLAKLTGDAPPKKATKAEVEEDVAAQVTQELATREAAPAETGKIDAKGSKE